MKKKIVSLINWPVFGLKAGLSAALSLGFAQGLGVADTVSAAFVAVVCSSPTALSGAKRAVEQLIGSLLGGAFGYAYILLGLSVPWALGMAVGLSVMVSGVLPMHQAYPVAAFTALYVVLLNPASPHVTYGDRLAAVLLGALAALFVNLLLSSLFYRVLFLRRIRLCRLALADALDEQSVALIDVASVLIRELDSDLVTALRRPLIERLLCETTHLTLIAHYAKDALIRDHAEVQAAMMDVSWALRGKAIDLEGDHALVLEGRRWASLTNA